MTILRPQRLEKKETIANHPIFQLVGVDCATIERLRLQRDMAQFHGHGGRGMLYTSCIVNGPRMMERGSGVEEAPSEAPRCHDCCSLSCYLDGQAA